MDTKSLVNLAVRIESEGDRESAISLFQKAACAGGNDGSPAQLHLSRLLDKIDSDEAVRLIQEALMNGVEMAQYSLATELFNGDETQKDTRKRFERFQEGTL
jgi:TPR repeat protein